MAETEIEVETDLEEELQNEERHFKKAHPSCGANRPPGIRIALCGALFRSRPESNARWDLLAIGCPDCIAAYPPAVCYWCGNG